MLKYERNTYILLFSRKSITKLKKEKIKNTIVFSFPSVLGAGTFLSYILSSPKAFLYMIISVVVFIIWSVIYKFRFEKEFGTAMISAKEEFKYYVGIALLEVIICIFII